MFVFVIFGPVGYFVYKFLECKQQEMLLFEIMKSTLNIQSRVLINAGFKLLCQ